ncbi:NADH:ubiquinone reductase (Na(+)-transporting) subunit C [Ancylomarina sp. 16SWW S1-10-2]|uniref:NADH:ubiquinone reductase (Na(+)-transporting) subunit C n=1 Tax=Ancylomarina sp. 16SWW S1-10-2 TaxID=2499681 RepID=UPI0012AE8093|nr:NADH:ubiquinone reductase (Na(+)-transporting) subunit C [Ancylomarina sp. 16SWW S1-10-2]MRT91836.1 NADH:ubiquinone reductase (Na(+)-transporting) subunit C [Ancylomarina sp. 16SWW S1-10-2]
MNTQSNTYTFLYASILVVLVAAVLSFTALQLKPRQAKNKEIEKKQDILKAVNVASTPENAEELYNQYIVKAIIVNSDGGITSEDKNATFDVDLKIENSKKNVAERKLPIFTFNKEGLGEKLIIPIRGRGMWGPIWGYISMEPDGKTIYGATFGNKGETPGLGAEISKAEFQKPFTGKQIFDESGKFTSLKLVKGTAQGHPHQFDAVSGGTVTSKGLEAMLQDNLSSYEKFLKSSK